MKIAQLRRRLKNMIGKPEQAEKPEKPGIYLRRKFLKHCVFPAKGWKTYKDAQIGNYTSTYLGMIDRQKTPATADFIVALAGILGNSGDPRAWSAPFLISEGKPLEDNHPANNMAKFEGRKRYSRSSISAKFRKLDNSGIEEKVK